MPATPLIGKASRLALIAATASIALAACNQAGAPAPNAAANAASNDLASNDLAPAPLAAIPLATDAAPTIVQAPAAAALPAAPPVRVGRVADPGQAYAFADRAAAMNSGFGDAPPDYAIDYGGGQRPWVWRADDHSTRIAEQTAGGYRYYYYEPGASAPYLVRDGGYSYGYLNGVLVAGYGPDGRLLAQEDLARRADIAGRILARAAAMAAAADHDRRQAVAEANWAARREQIAEERAQWAQDQQADANWRAYHDAHQQQDQAYWAAERYRRETEAARFAQQINDARAEQRALDEARLARQQAGYGPPRGGQNWGPQPGGQPGGWQGGRPANGPQPGQPWNPGHQPGGPRNWDGQPGGPQAPLNGQAQADAARRAQLIAQQQAQAAQAQANAARQAQLLAAQRQAAANTAAARAAQAQAAHDAQLQARAARQAQMLAAQKQAQAQAQAQRAAQAQAAAAKLASQRQAQLHAQAVQAAKAQAAQTHAAQTQAAHDAAVKAHQQGQAARATGEKATNSATSPRANLRNDQ